MPDLGCKIWMAEPMEFVLEAFDDDRLADTGPDTALELVDSQSTPGGVNIQVYRPTGRLRYATATAG